MIYTSDGHVTIETVNDETHDGNCPDGNCPDGNCHECSSLVVEFRTRNREPGFESPFATVSKIGHFSFTSQTPLFTQLYK